MFVDKLPFAALLAEDAADARDLGSAGSETDH